MSRRYEIGIHPAYDQRYNALTSPAATSQPDRDLQAMRLSGKAGVKREISDLQARAEQIRQAIEGVEATKDVEGVDGINQRFERLKVQARRMGKVEPEMPRQLLEEKLWLEARLDVTIEEMDKIKEMLAGIEAREQVEQDAKILQYGPQGSGHGDPLLELDGQPIRVNRKGILVIDCPKSPYHKMLVEDYRTHLVAPFAKARSQKSREFEDAIAEKKRELQELKKLRPNLGGIIARENLPARPKGL